MRQVFNASLFVILGIILGVLGYRAYLSSSGHRTAMDSTVVLEQIRDVAKLVTVEGDFSNMLTYKDYRWFDFGPFQRQAIVKVKSKVAVGFDLSKLKIDADQTRKVIKIGKMPDPEVIAVDNDLSYYDLQEGLFNSFDAEELTNINRTAKKYIEYVVQNKPYVPTNPQELLLQNQYEKTFAELFKGGKLLRERAIKSAREKMKLIEFIAEAAGWTVEYEDDYMQKAPVDNTKIDSLKN
jgi:hypothetical protein